jgi:hypothetical protein
LRQDDLPQVLCQATPKGNKLPQEEVRTHKQPQTQKEAEVDLFVPFTATIVVKPSGHI